MNEPDTDAKLAHDQEKAYGRDHKDWVESCHNQIIDNPMEHLDSPVPMAELLVFIQETIHPDQFRELLSAWIKTPDGERWYSEMLDQLVNNRPEAHDYD